MEKVHSAVNQLPQVWKALLAVAKRNLSGVITVHTDTDTAYIYVTDGSVVNLESPHFSPKVITQVLYRMRILSGPDMAKAQRLAQKEDMTVPQAALALGLIKEETLDRIQNFLLKEALLELINDETATVEFREMLPGTVSGNFRLPISFLLKEAGKRKKEWPHIKTKIPFMETVVKRKEIIDPVTGRPYAWEDLPLEGVEKIVYFFLDGNRTVSEIAGMAFISEFDVARAIYSLLNKDMAEKITYYKDENDSGATTIKKKVGLGGIILGYVISLIIVVSVVAGLYLSWLMPSNSKGVVNQFATSLTELIEQQSMLRCETAMEVFYLRQGEWPQNFQALMSTNLVLMVDKKSAMKVKIPGTSKYLYQDVPEHEEQ